MDDTILPHVRLGRLVKSRRAAPESWAQRHVRRQARAFEQFQRGMEQRRPEEPIKYRYLVKNVRLFKRCRSKALASAVPRQEGEPRSGTGEGLPDPRCHGMVGQHASHRDATCSGRCRFRTGVPRGHKMGRTNGEKCGAATARAKMQRSAVVATIRWHIRG